MTDEKDFLSHILIYRDKILNSSEPSDLQAVIDAFCQSIGIPGFTVSIYRGDQNWELTNRNPELMDLYYRNNWYSVDPIFAISCRVWHMGLPGFLWSEEIAKEELTEAGKLVMESGREFGIEDGFNVYATGSLCHVTLSLHGDNAEHVGSIWRRYSQLMAFLATSINHRYAQWISHDERLIDLMDALNNKDVELLRLVSEGKTYSEAGRVIGVKEVTVRKRMRSCVKKMQVANATAAVVRFASITNLGVFPR